MPCVYWHGFLAWMLWKCWLQVCRLGKGLQCVHVFVYSVMFWHAHLCVYVCVSGLWLAMHAEAESVPALGGGVAMDAMSAHYLHWAWAVSVVPPCLPLCGIWIKSFYASRLQQPCNMADSYNLDCSTGLVIFTPVHFLGERFFLFKLYTNRYKNSWTRAQNRKKSWKRRKGAEKQLKYLQIH